MAKHGLDVNVETVMREMRNGRNIEGAHILLQMLAAMGFDATHPGAIAGVIHLVYALMAGNGMSYADMEKLGAEAVDMARQAGSVEAVTVLKEREARKMEQNDSAEVEKVEDEIDKIFDELGALKIKMPRHMM